MIGHGHVALDVARILAKTGGGVRRMDIVAHALAAWGDIAITRIGLVGRCRPHAIAMTVKEPGDPA